VTRDEDNAAAITVAAIQALPKGSLLDPANVPHAVELLRKAAEGGANIACFPEAYPATGEKEICRATGDLGLYTVASFLQKEGEKLYNEGVLIDPHGQVVGRQRKINPVPGVEPYTPGSEYEIMETPFGKIGILICIDGWGFPEGFYQLSQAGVDLIFNPCLIFKKKPHKRMSLLARVFDYKVPIVSPNNAVWSLRIFPDDPGISPEGGESLILAPPPFKTANEIEEFMKEAVSCEGWILAEGGREEEILTANIDIAALRHTRSMWKDCFGACLT
jgi:predicted amidohydrolase